MEEIIPLDDKLGEGCEVGERHGNLTTQTVVADVEKGEL